MKKLMSANQIKTKFSSEWVLVENPETAKTLEVKNGIVLFHSKNRDAVYRRARKLRPKHSAILFTGSLPKSTVVVL